MAKTVFRLQPPARRGGKTDDSRNRIYRAVLAACNRLGIDDEERKAIQLDLIGKLSMKDMTFGELGRLLDQFNKNWTGPMGHRAHIGKIRALWWTLYWLGEASSSHDGALDAFVKKQTGIDALRFLDHRQARSVIEALKSWATRAGVCWPTPEDTAEALSLMATTVFAQTNVQIAQPVRTNPAMLTTGQHERIAVLHAIAAKLGGDPIGDAARALNLQPYPLFWSVHELDAGIRRLGRALRKLKG